MLDGKYWVVYGGELLGVTTDERNIRGILENAYMDDQGIQPEHRDAVRVELALSIRLKFDMYQLLVREIIQVDGYYAVNTGEL